MKLALHHTHLNKETALQIFKTCKINIEHVTEHRQGLYSIICNEDAAIQYNQLNQTCAQARCDWAAIPSEFTPASFKVLAMDMDSTLINIECIDEIADFVGKKTEVSAITEAAMRGEIPCFSESLKRRVALLQGVEELHLQAVFEQRLQLNPGALELLAFAKTHGWKTLLVSGGFSYFTDRLQALLNLDYTRSNTLEIINGKLTGQVLGEIVDAEKKADALAKLCHTLNQTCSCAIVIGDGANDLNMMALAGASVAYHAKPVVQAQARFSINYGGLNTLLAWFEVNT